LPDAPTPNRAPQTPSSDGPENQPPLQGPSAVQWAARLLGLTRAIQQGPPEDVSQHIMQRDEVLHMLQVSNIALLEEPYRTQVLHILQQTQALDTSSLAALEKLKKQFHQHIQTLKQSKQTLNKYKSGMTDVTRHETQG